MGIELISGCQMRGEPGGREARTVTGALLRRLVIQIEWGLRGRFWAGSAALDVVLPQPEERVFERGRWS